MFGSKLLGLVLSALIGASPIHFISAENPLTRVDTAYYRTSYTVDDLGPMAAVGSDNHVYIIHYTTDIYCSSACRITTSNISAAPINVTDTHLQYSYNIRISQRKPQAMYDIMNDFTQLNTNTYGMVTETNTYTSDDAVAIMLLQTKYAGANGVAQMWIYVEFLAEDVLTSIAHDVNELNDWYFVRNFLVDNDVPSTDVQMVTNMISNDNYNSAVEYIQNYYISTSVTKTQNNETVVNNYESKETNFQTLFNTENNFSNQVETDFNNRMNDIDLTPSLPSQNSFLQSANWVTTQFNRLTSNNAFGQLLGFSLIVGLLLALIGRFLA